MLEALLRLHQESSLKSHRVLHGFLTLKEASAGAESRSVVPASGLAHGKMELAREAAVKSR